MIAFVQIQRCMFVYIYVLTCFVLPARSDSDFMRCLQSYQGLIIDGSLVCWSGPQDRISTQVIYRLAL